MSRIHNNKHYTSIHAYHALNINGIPPTGQNSKNDASGLINIIRDHVLSGNTHLAQIIISPTVSDGKLTTHEIARSGKYTFYNVNTRSEHNIKINGVSTYPNESYLTIRTTRYIRDIYSSKLVTASANNAGGGGGSSVTQYWS